jgi:hypothetical protein
VETLTAFLEQRRSDLSSLTPAQGVRGSVRAGHDSSYHRSRFTGGLDVSWTRRLILLPRGSFDGFRKSTAAGPALGWTRRQQHRIR